MIDYWTITDALASMKKQLHTMEFWMIGFAERPCKSNNPRVQQRAYRKRAVLALEVRKLRQIVSDMEVLKASLVRRVCKRCGLEKELKAFPVIPIHSILSNGERKTYYSRRRTCQDCITERARLRILLLNRNKELYAA